ncbi:hypothetical protein MLD38_014058 [Melastoma candidum]|uniref:Uncharacterized protein n=1 Tax=Melastoma candidum TaxID=119954 RepID=A0ACB9RAX6_9MYRT|nr:hypothetical protein MLD38_014058 [Melastoma candidum]
MRPWTPRKGSRKRRGRDAAGRRIRAASVRKDLKKLCDIIPGCGNEGRGDLGVDFIDKVLDYVLLLELKVSLLRGISSMYGV